MNRKFLAIIVVPAVLTIASGCAAKYQTIRKSQGGENQGSGTGHGEDAVPTPLAPSAQVEVVVDGKIVVKVKAGTPFVIRPSESTLDPDNRDDKDCRNPGIVKAVYAPGSDAAKATARTGAECTSLEVNHSFPQPGVFKISMTVTSDEQETATSKMTLEVVPADSPDSATDGGFIVKADPLIAETGENIVFAGDCAAAKEITWNFKDTDNKSPGKGAQVAKAYSTPGQYQVEAECLNKQDEILTGEISVVVIPKKQTTGPDQPGNNTDQGDNTQTPGDGDKPGDNTPPGNSNPPADNTPPGNSNPPADNTPPGNSNPPGDNTPPDDNDSDKPDDSSPGNPGQNPGQSPYQGKI